ncbi:MAG: sulfate permease [Anaerolineales bacterium]|nr:sulfate permease [Anaerolineales bacterium]
MTTERANASRAWAHWVPVLGWVRHYQRDDLVSDLIAGVVVAIMLVPQGMAYAMLAGLPAEVGLYASILPLILYGLLGTSRTLAVGPVAIVSLLVATGIVPLAEAGSAQYVALALTLALMVGLIQFVMGIVKLGTLVNFLSHPVISGFTSAAAIVIGWSQLKHVLGFNVPRGEFIEQVTHTLGHLGETNPVTLLIGLAGVGTLLFFKNRLGSLLQKVGLPATWVVPLTKAGPLLIVALGALLVGALGLDQRSGVGIVGNVPAGRPPLTLPQVDTGSLRALLPTALAISFVGYMESVSVAKSLASKRREKIDANQELIALGVANLGAAVTAGYPVTGGFSRSVVNFAAGARSGLASILTALLVALTLLFLTPLFYYLPQAILAAIILVAVAGLIDTKSFVHAWRYSKADAFSLLVTFFAVLLIGVEQGILVGVVVTIALYLWRTSRPHVAEVGRVGDSEIYRNVARHTVQTSSAVHMLRVDESLYFANSKFLEDTVLAAVADHPDIKAFVLVGTAINFIDASALETLEQLHHALEAVGVEMHFAALKGPVMDRLRTIGFVDEVGAQRFHLSPHDAMIALGAVAPTNGHQQRQTLPAYAPVKR